MKELNAVEIMQVSGAGKISDGLTNWYGSLFSSLYNLTANFTDTNVFGESEAAATASGKEIGAKIGNAIESGITTWINSLNSLLN